LWTGQNVSWHSTRSTLLSWPSYNI
jgi:hypothetical protein